MHLPRYELKSLKYFLQSVALNSGLSTGRSTLYLRSSTGENETDLGDAERVRTDDIPLESIKGGGYLICRQSSYDCGCEKTGYFGVRRRVIGASDA